MTGTQYVFEWLAVLFVVTGLLLAFIRAHNYWNSRFHKPDPRPDEIPNDDHHFSLRRLK